MLYRILSTDGRAGVVMAASMSLLVAPGSAVMTASGAIGNDGVVAMTATVSQYHWIHVWFTYVPNVYLIIYSAESEMT